jgi:hypothetical protein
MFSPFEAMRLSMRTGMMLAEANMVIGMRMLGMAGMWRVQPSENRRMVAEKQAAGAEAALAMGRAVMQRGAGAGGGAEAGGAADEGECEAAFAPWTKGGDVNANCDKPPDLCRHVWPYGGRPGSAWRHGPHHRGRA